MSVNSRLESWQKVWERKGREAKGLSLNDLITIDGFDGGAGKMTDSMWFERVEHVKSALKLDETSSLLEVGCGAGAMLLPLSSTALKLAGIDYSAPLVDIAKKAVPQAEIKISEAASIPFPDRSFTRVLVHGVIHYFPSEDYTKKVMEEVLRVLEKGGGLLIADIPDIAKKEESEQQRKTMAEREGKSYLTTSEGDYSHLYFSREFFIRFFRSYGFEADILEWTLDGYGNSEFRFCVSVWT